VSDDPLAVAQAADAVVLNRVRAGEVAEYEMLHRRHEPAVRRLARLLVPPAHVDGVVAEAFSRVREETLGGGGPDDAFRLSVLSAARRVSDDRVHSQRAPHVSPGADPSEPPADIAVGSAGARLIAEVFQSLPERWIAVLWHTEIEGASAADAALVLGLTAEEAAVLQREAVDGLQQACLEAYISGVARPECQRVTAELAAYIRDVAAARDRAIVTDHLDRCKECREVCFDLADIRSMLREVVAPIFLGGAAAWYLRAAREAAEGTDGAAPGQTPGSDAAGGGTRRGHLLRTPARRRWAAAAAAAAVLLAGVLVLGLRHTGDGTSSARPQAAPALDPSQTSQVTQPPGTQTGKPQPSKAARSSVRTRPVAPSASSSADSRSAASPSAGNSSPASPSPGNSSPASASPPAAGAAQLSATVAITNEDPEGNDEAAVEAEVAFDVTNTGSAATGAVDVTLIGAPLWSVVSGSWTCQATDTGATCQDSAIPAGGQAQEVLILRTFTETPCGEPVQLTAVSGSAQASAQSPQVMNC
jgi:DNA-directed RNA polymerase specialized sigma24 family protein